jgi:alkylation response protein AidB-like acyl-CoA dehydrogenase
MADASAWSGSAAPFVLLASDFAWNFRFNFLRTALQGVRECETGDWAMSSSDPKLSEVERAMYETAHRFAREVMRPAGVTLDRLSPAEAIARDSVYWKVMEQYHELGLDLIEVFEGLDPVERTRLAYIVNEEIGWGDAGLGISLYAQSFPGLHARESGSALLQERFTTEQIGCVGLTEPDHGSDMVDFHEGVCRKEDGLLKANCRARRDGYEVVIHGQKSAWVVNAPIADTMLLFCRYDDGSANPGGGVFLVPLDTVGVTRGSVTDKLGLRPLPQGEIFFDQVRIPIDYLVAGPGAYCASLGKLLCGANPSVGIFMIGVARAAYELALQYARDRVQGGRPIIEHQSVKQSLFRMFRRIEAARAFNRHVLLTNAALEHQRMELASAAKVTSTETALEVAHDALQIFGALGTTRACPIEKLLRDARMGMIADGNNEVLSLMAATRL